MLWNIAVFLSVIQEPLGFSKTLSGDEVKTMFTIILKPYFSISFILYRYTEFRKLIDGVSDSTLQLPCKKL